MVWYITSELKVETMGGIGHTYYDVITGYIIAKLFNLVHVHTPFAKGDTTAMYKAQGPMIGPGTLNIQPDTSWEKFLGLGINEFEKVECQQVRINLVQKWKSFTVEQLTQFFAQFDRNRDIFFIITNNNRIQLFEFYTWSPHLYNELRTEMKEKCVYKANTVTGRVVVHIRRGDLCEEPLEYSLGVLQKIRNIVDIQEIIVISYGTTEQMAEIQSAYDKFLKVRYELNTDTLECFKLMINAQILVCGRRSFARIAGYYSNAVIIYLPFRQGENYDKKYIPASINGEFNNELLINALQ